MNSVLSRSSFTPRRPAAEVENKTVVFSEARQRTLSFPVLVSVRPPSGTGPGQAICCCPLLSCLSRNGQTIRKKEDVGSRVDSLPRHSSRTAEIVKKVPHKALRADRQYLLGRFSTSLFAGFLLARNFFVFFWPQKTVSVSFQTGNQLGAVSPGFASSFFPVAPRFWGGKQKKKENAKVMRAMARQHHTARIY